MKRKQTPINPSIKGDDFMHSGTDSSMFNNQPSEDDYEAERKERIEAERLKPHLELLTTIVHDEIYDMNNITHLLNDSKNFNSNNMLDVLIELRARKLHLEWLEGFSSKIKNIQNTLDELRND